MKIQVTSPVFQRNHGITMSRENGEVQSEFKVVQIPSHLHPFDCTTYNKKGLFKISIHHGHNRVFYDDQVFEFKDYAILFSRPNVVYRFEPLGVQHAAHFCVFPASFFDQFVNIENYPLFNPEVSPLSEITAEQMTSFAKIFLRLEQEVAMDFSFKNDSLRNQVLEMILDGLKLQPVSHSHVRKSNSAVRLASNFKRLLEAQFPMTNSSHRLTLRHPIEFADSLSVHVNHLNRSLKQVTDKTTTQLIADRLMKEAKVLLQDTDWNIIEIAWCLGFEDRAHFIKFFKKNIDQSPGTFRKLLPV